MCWQQREQAGSGSPCEGPWEPFSSGAPSPAYPWCRAHCPTSLLAPRDTERVGCRASLLMSPATLQHCVLSAGVLAAS